MAKAKELADSQDRATGPPSGGRLDSWKEIAAYLNHSERTVRRWQGEGLPVHRHPHKKRAGVYAYRLEIDAWWNDGHIRLEEIERAQLARRRPWRLWVAAGCLVVLVLVPGIYLLRARMRPRAKPPAGKIMFAVLPFENLSGDPEQEYFSDGLTEEMISRLGQMDPQRLGVIARTSAIQYKGTKKRIDQIGQELGVDYILEGTVRRAGQHLRISAQLIQVSDQTHLWARSYEGELRDVLALQDDIARSIAKQVRANLTPQEEARLAAATKVDPEAYELFLKGRYEWAKRGRGGLTKGLEFFTQSAARNPSYAPAYVGMAESYGLLGNNELMPGDQVFPKAKSAARKALELDPDLGEAHSALAEVLNDYEWNWVAAEKEFRRAIELDPSNVTAHHWYAMSLVWAGRSVEAINEIERARELDPAAVHVNTNVGLILLWARQYDRAIVAAQKTLELEPDDPTAHHVLGMSYLQKGNSEKAISEFQTNVASSPRDPRRLSRLAYAYAMTGQKRKAVSLLANINQLSVHTYCPPTSIAIVYGALGQNDEAFSWLEKALLKPGGSEIMSIKVNPLFDPLRSDPRFSDALRRRGLAQ